VSRFFDTNVLIYAQQEGQKADTARRLMAEGGFISVQVLNEFANVTRRKLGLAWGDVEAAIADILAVMEPPLPIGLSLSATARELAADHGLSFYDALIVAAAMEAKCTVLLTEDMQAGRRFEDLTIVNPFVEEG
jgi:predicted nucleic acid-binding protein